MQKNENIFPTGVAIQCAFKLQFVLLGNKIELVAMITSAVC